MANIIFFHKDAVTITIPDKRTSARLVTQCSDHPDAEQQSKVMYETALFHAISLFTVPRNFSFYYLKCKTTNQS